MHKFLIVVFIILLVATFTLTALMRIPPLLSSYLRYTMVFPNDHVVQFDNVKEGRFICGIEVQSGKWSCILMKLIKQYRINLK